MSASAPRTLKMVLAYDGTNYCGWQKQKGQPTIQAAVQEMLGKMTRETVHLHGAGRTDAGVHALGMVASFQTCATIPCQAFLMGLNSMLPADIRILDVIEAPDGFHARRSARAKTYCYHVTNSAVQLPTERLYSYLVTGPLDVEAIRAGMQYLIGEHDFSSFEAAGSRDLANKGGRGAVRTIFSAKFEKNTSIGGRFTFEFVGDGFLRHMIRNIVGTLIEVGRGKRTPEDIRTLLRAADRSFAGPCAPAHGLFLQAVHY